MVAVAVFALNIPFGYWRETTRRFSPSWFLAIHMPIPLAVALRTLAGLGWQIGALSVLAVAFSLGQLLGGKLHQWRSASADIQPLQDQDKESLAGLRTQK